MAEPPSDPSIWSEPHLAPDEPPAPPEPRDESVWDEPAVSPALAGEPPPGTPSYAARLERELAARRPGASWWVTAGVALGAGPWAVVGALLAPAQASGMIALVALFGPLAEEVMKAAAAAIVIERRPWLFASAGQIVIACATGGLVFAAVENALYLLVYVSHPTPELVLWRWTVCVALHTGCSALTGGGVARVWQEVWRQRVRPDLTWSWRWLVAAVAIHGAYNLAATAWELGTPEP
jgi:hypothetical protein